MRNLWEDATHRVGDHGIFLIDEAKELGGGQTVEMPTAGIGLLGGQARVVHGHACEDNMGLGAAQPACYNLVDVRDT